jgi:hypothetical protein
MTLTGFRTAVVTMMAVAAATVTAVPAIAGDSGKLEPGVWIARVTDYPGIFPQWTYIVSPDPSGRHGAAYGTVEVALYNETLDALTDRTSPLLVDIVMTGPKTAKFNSVWYGLKDIAAPVYVDAEVVYIGVNRGEIQFVAPGKAEGTHNIEYYWASQDDDHDGLPDPGELPFAEVGPIHTLETRLGQ